jgi:PhzF family phenazine biosynthesis protein
MNPTHPTYRPSAGTWAIHVFVTFLLLLSSLFWFFDPGPFWIRLLGAAILAYWAYVLVGVARSKIELREQTLEIHSLPYRLPTKGVASWLYAVLVFFIVVDVFALIDGPFSRDTQRLLFYLRLTWLGAYLITLLRNLPKGRRSIPYAEIESLPWEAEWGPQPRIVSHRSLFVRVAGEAEPFLLPTWLNAADRHDLTGRLTAHVKHARLASGTLRRLAAFTTNPQGGNPAGVWVGDRLPSAADMQRIAAEVGYSETAFLAPATGHVRDVRYYSPLAEVPFCGHATIASGVALGDSDGEGRFSLRTIVGEVPVEVSMRDDRFVAALTSVEPRQEPVKDTVLDRILDLLGWSRADLDPAIPPVRAFAGAWHLVLAAREQARLATLDYDFEALQRAMLDDDLTTLQLVWREDSGLFHARNPFPVGGVVEDPATGAAAAALGGYLRALGSVTAPATIQIRQGDAMGRPSRIEVEIPATGGIVVRGNAVPMG